MSAHLLPRALLALALASACDAAPPVQTEARTQAVIYGDDDRQEVFEIGDPQLRAIAERSVVALMPFDNLADDQGRVVFRTVVTAKQLCPDERFGDQRAVAQCSGLVLTPETVLTAGHCVHQLGPPTPTDPDAERGGGSMPCPDLALVQGVHYTGPGQLNVVRPANVFRCAEILSRRYHHGINPPPRGVPWLDFAVIRLDRPVADAEPVAVSASLGTVVSKSLERQAVTALGFPLGLPMKLARGTIYAARGSADYFTTTLDVFNGNSGSPVFGEGNQLIGVLARGGKDWIEPREGPCDRVRQVPDEPSEAEENVTYAAHALNFLCDTTHAFADCAQPAYYGYAGCAAAPGRPATPGIVVLAAFLVGCAVSRRRRG